MRWNDWGQIAMDCWRAIPAHFPNISLDEFIIMPNHVHGIVVMDDGVGAGSPRPYGSTPSDIETAPPSPSLGNIVAYFKYQTAKRINQRRNTPAAPVWQRNYYDHIIRNDDELSRIRKYARNNPARWATDIENGFNPAGYRRG
jgi:putative transposase